MSARSPFRRALGPLLAGLALLASPLRAETSPPAWGDQLTLYVIPAPRTVDWRRPRTLALSALGNQIAFEHRDHKHSIGHVFVHLTSSLAGRDVMTGMSNRVATEDRDLILEDGYGMGVLGADMMGELEDGADLAAEIEQRAASGLMASMRFLLSPEAAARMVQFLDEYRAQGLDDHYGGANRPRYREGGGCSAFAMAFLELGGLVLPEYQDWRVDFRVPLAFYGGPLTGLRASFRRILLEGSRWAREDEPHVDSMFWDPTRMFRWIDRTWKAEAKAPTGAYALEQRQELRGLVRDARGVAVPDEPIWLEDPPGQSNPYGRQISVRREETPPPAAPLP